MSEANLETLNLSDVIARIERAQAETRKFVAEQNKLNAEQSKLSAEASKLTRDRNLAPLQIVVGAMAAGAALFGAGAEFWKVVGG